MSILAVQAMTPMRVSPCLPIMNSSPLSSSDIYSLPWEKKSLPTKPPSFVRMNNQLPRIPAPLKAIATPPLKAIVCSGKTNVLHLNKTFASSEMLNVFHLNNNAPRKATGNPIIVIDNYDSFTYNLCQYLGELGCRFQVYRNDELTIDELKNKKPRGILISSGPGAPQDSGISLQTVLELGPSVPILGVCMGLQCIGEAFGAKIARSPFGVMHGKNSLVHYDEGEEVGLLAGLSNPFIASRYHSLVIEKESFPSDKLEITACTEDGLIMAIRHKEYKYLQGVQFHPESIMTSEGKIIIENFIRLIEKKEAETGKTTFRATKSISPEQTCDIKCNINRSVAVHDVTNSTTFFPNVMQAFTGLLRHFFRM